MLVCIIYTKYTKILVAEESTSFSPKYPNLLNDFDEK
jgi:hypothetical protein